MDTPCISFHIMKYLKSIKDATLKEFYIMVVLAKDTSVQLSWTEEVTPLHLIKPFV